MPSQNQRNKSQFLAEKRTDKGGHVFVPTRPARGIQRGHRKRAHKNLKKDVGWLGVAVTQQSMGKMPYFVGLRRCASNPTDTIINVFISGNNGIRFNRKVRKSIADELKKVSTFGGIGLGAGTR